MMRWQKINLTTNDPILRLLNSAANFVKDALKDMETNDNALLQPILDKVTNELMYFCFFALDYGISNNAIAQKEQAIRELLHYHWRQILGDDDSGQIMWKESAERLLEYAQIINETQTNEAHKLVRLGTKLAEHSDCPRYSRLIVLAPFLFKAMMDNIKVVLPERK